MRINLVLLATFTFSFYGFCATNCESHQVTIAQLLEDIFCYKPSVAQSGTHPHPHFAVFHLSFSRQTHTLLYSFLPTNTDTVPSSNVFCC